MNPVLTALGLTLISVTVLVAVTAVRWWLSKSHWEHHPAGREGHFKDAVLITATFAPMIIAALIFRIVVLSNPHTPPSPFVLGGLGVAFVLRVALRRISPFAPASQRLTDSRLAAQAARKAAKLAIDKKAV